MKMIFPCSRLPELLKERGIETALELIDRLDDKHVKLVITGSDGG